MDSRRSTARVQVVLPNKLKLEGGFREAILTLVDVRHLGLMNRVCSV